MLEVTGADLRDDPNVVGVVLNVQGWHLGRPAPVDGNAQDPAQGMA
ncbi:MAG TPA: hypothetical protein VMN58_00460 [Acidimicrobiales bacterium]|nr:hypothetical protein [Acidimicrobiales bacterium]